MPRRFMLDAIRRPALLVPLLNWYLSSTYTAALLLDAPDFELATQILVEELAL